MNWTNFDLLVSHLESMLARGEAFNYMQGWDTEIPGCLDCQCRILMGRHGKESHAGGLAIRKFLNVEPVESANLWIPDASEEHPDETFVGAKGIREALRKLDLVASRYTRPTISTDLETTKAADRERAFLVRCMAVAAEPVEVE